MYQDLSFMNVPLPEDILKLKIYGDYAGAQKMIHYFLEEKDIPQALRKRLEIEQEVIGVMGGNEYPFTYDEALEIMKSHLRDFKKEELDHLKEKKSVQPIGFMWTARYIFSVDSMKI